MTERHPEVCVSCGMPMRTAAEHVGADPSRDFCNNCAQESGEMKSYAEVLAGFAGFLQHTQGLQGEAALDAAARVLRNQPAWSDR